MRSKDMFLQIKNSIIGMKIQNKPEKAKTVGVVITILKGINAQVNSTTSKFLKDHR